MEVKSTNVLKKVYKSPLRWTGSKKKLLNEMIVMFDQQKKYYVEPFLGSGVVLINLLQFDMYTEYFVNDINVNLINFYLDLKENAILLCNKMEKISKEFNELDTIDKKEKYYYKKRKQFNSNRLESQTRSAIFWYLMKVGYNGVYRVNSKNEFNVPFGKKYIINFDKSYFFDLSKLIQNVHFYCMDYQSFLLEVAKIKTKKDLFIYCDPPYLPETPATKNQILYTSDKFDHKKFLEFMQSYYFEYCSIMISMSKSEIAIKLYNEYFKYSVKVNDIIRIVNPKKRLKSVEMGYLNYISENISGL